MAKRNETKVLPGRLYTNGKTVVHAVYVRSDFVGYCVLNRSDTSTSDLSVTAFLKRYPRRVERIEIVEE